MHQSKYIYLYQCTVLLSCCHGNWVLCLRLWTSSSTIGVGEKMAAILRLLLVLLSVVECLTNNAAKRQRRSAGKSGVSIGIEKGGGCQTCGTSVKHPEAGPESCRQPGLKGCYKPPVQVKCCDSACPKCVGGIAPAPGSSGCLFGCPNGVSCPGTCPCDECVCCYTSTRWLTETSTCLDSTTVQVIQQDTSTEQKYYSTVTTLIQPITFTVTDIFSFTSLTTFTDYPTEATTSTSISTSIEILSSTLEASTVTLEAVLFTFTANTTVSIFENPVSTVIDTDVTSTVFSRFSFFETTTTIITGFSYSVTGFAATSTVGMPGTFYEYVYPEGTLSIITATFADEVFSTINRSAVTTVYDTLEITEPRTQSCATSIKTIDFTPTMTEFTTAAGPVPFRLPFFPE